MNIELVEIPADDIRISYIYSILVKQWSLSNEAYRYYRALEQYVEESSGLFAPMPSELKGNISCISNPDVNVQGYVLASTLQTKRIFVYNSDFTKVYPRYDGGCSWKTPDLSDNNWSHIWGESIKKGAIAITTNGYYQPSLNPNYGESTLYSRECVDCPDAYSSQGMATVLKRCKAAISLARARLYEKMTGTKGIDDFIRQL